MRTRFVRPVLAALLSCACVDFELVGPTPNRPPFLNVNLMSLEDSAPRVAISAYFSAGSGADGRSRALVDSAFVVNGEAAAYQPARDFIHYTREWTAPKEVIPPIISVRGPRPDGTSAGPSMTLPRLARLDPMAISIAEGTALRLNVSSLPDTVGSLIGDGSGLWSLDIVQPPRAGSIFSLQTQRFDAPPVDIPWNLFGGTVRANDVLTVRLFVGRVYEMATPYRTTVYTISQLTWKVTVVAATP